MSSAPSPAISPSPPPIATPSPSPASAPPGGPSPAPSLHFNSWAPADPPQFKALTNPTSPLEISSGAIRSNLPIEELWIKPCVGYSHRHAFIVDGDGDWSVLRLVGVSKPKILSLCVDVAHCKVYGLLSAGRLFVVGTNDMSWELLDVAELPDMSKVLRKRKLPDLPHILQLNRTLVQCDNGELMLVLMVGAKGGETRLYSCSGFKWRLAAIKTYRLDFERLVWVEVEGLGDWCLFMDAIGGCAVSGSLEMGREEQLHLCGRRA